MAQPEGSASVTVTVPPVVAPPSNRLPSRTRLYRRLRQPRTALSVLWLSLLAVACVVPSLLTGQDAEATDLSASLQKPSLDHWLGTDKLGRDLLAQVIYGARSVLLATIVASVVALVIGIPLGLIAGYSGRWREVTISRFADGLMALPTIIILLAVAGILDNNLTIAMAVLGVILSAGFIRLVRTSTQATRSELFVDAARVHGVSPARIVTRHILPNIASPLVVQTSIGLGIGILAVAGLSFLGLGPPPPEPTWGSMVYQATQNLSVAPWQLFPSGVAILFTVLAFNYVGDAIIDLPRVPRVPRAARRSAGALSAVTVTGEVANDAESGLLVVRDLTVILPSLSGEPVLVLDRVSFTVQRGEAVALVGESGCGKTMTSRSVLGMLPRGGTIVAGSIAFDGLDLTARTERQWTDVRGSGIAYVAQEPLVALDPCFSVGSLVSEALRRHRKVSRSEARVAAAALLTRVGIQDPDSVLQRFAHQLSGGMAQRVAIALALTGSPSLLIADEPTSALDVTVQADLLDLLRSLQQETGMAVLLVSHDFGVVADFCTKALVMYAGQVVERGPVDEMFSAPAHPYTARLLAATPHGAAPGEDLPTIEGMVPPPGFWPAGCHFAPRCPRTEEACTLGPIPVATPAAGRDSRCLFAAQEMECPR